MAVASEEVAVSHLSQLPRTFTARFGRAGRGRHQRAHPSKQFAGCIINGVTGLFAILIVAVNDLVKHGPVFGALDFFLQAAGAVVFVLALESKATVRSKNLSTGKAP